MFARLERAQSIPSPHFLEVKRQNQRENKKVFKNFPRKKEYLRKTRVFSIFHLEGLNKTFSLQVGE